MIEGPDEEWAAVLLRGGSLAIELRDLLVGSYRVTVKVDDDSKAKTETWVESEVVTVR